MTAATLDALARVPGLTLLDHTESARFAVDGQAPAAVARPADAAAVGALLTIASERGLRVIPRGGGTAIDLGNRPAAVDVVLDLSGLDAFVEYRPQDLTVTVQAGITIAALQQELEKHGQIIALDPPLPDRATVGGTLAAHLSGPRRYRYGTARDLVIGTSAVLADGTTARSGGRVVKNVAGYDLNKLFIGSAGTLAVITQVTFKLLPSPPERAMVVAPFQSPEAAHRMAMTVYNSTLTPLTLDLAGPGVLVDVSEPLFACRSDDWLVVVEAGGTPAAVDRTRVELAALAKSAGARSVLHPDERGREQLGDALRDFGRRPGAEAVLLLRAAVLPSQVAEAVTVLHRAPVGARPPDITARAGNGVVLAAWPELPGGEVAGEVVRLRGAIAALGGTLVVERCPPAIKGSLDVWGISGPDVELMRRVKQAFDPGDVLSPGRGPERI